MKVNVIRTVKATCLPGSVLEISNEQYEFLKGYVEEVKPEKKTKTEKKTKKEGK